MMTVKEYSDYFYEALMKNYSAIKAEDTKKMDFSEDEEAVLAPLENQLKANDSFLRALWGLPNPVACSITAKEENPQMYPVSLGSKDETLIKLGLITGWLRVPPGIEQPAAPGTAGHCPASPVLAGEPVLPLAADSVPQPPPDLLHARLDALPDPFRELD